MKCSLLRLVKQISVATGKEYHGSFADQLSKYNYPSAYWISGENLKKLNVAVKPDQLDHGITLQRAILYNASQTTDPKKIESLSGRIQPRFAISGGAMKLDEVPIPEKGENAWVTESQLQNLQMKVKPKFQAITIQVDNKPIKCYTVESVEESEKLQKALKIRHYSLSTGIPYGGSALVHLIKDTIQKGFTSGIWLSMARIEKLGAKLKPDQTPTCFSGDSAFTVYNADQLEDKSEVERAFEEKMSYQISGLSGKNFPKDISEQLYAEMKKNPSFSRYWIAQNQVHKEGGPLAGEEPVQIQDSEGSKNYYNASQLKSYVMKKCVKAHKEQIREKF